jgi:hypothetical protein
MPPLQSGVAVLSTRFTSVSDRLGASSTPSMASIWGDDRGMPEEVRAWIDAALAGVLRTPERGIGEPSAVQRMIVLQGSRLVALGIIIGTAAAFLTARYLSTVLFGVGAGELTAMALVPLALMGAGLAACMVPGRRAAMLDPAVDGRDAA